MTIIGFVGTSRHGILKDATVDERLVQVKQFIEENRHSYSSIVIVSGGGQIARRVLDPKLFGDDVEYLQLTNEKVQQTYAKRINIGKKHGAESSTLLQLCDILVRVGGGKQSHDEMNQFKTLKPNAVVLEFDPPTISSD
jgi:hypothetical protein